MHVESFHGITKQSLPWLHQEALRHISSSTASATPVFSGDTTAIRCALSAITAVWPPDYRALGLLIQHCADRKLLFSGRQIHGRLVILSIIPDNFLASKLLTLYSRCGQIANARRVFDEIPQRNLFAWNAMLLAYSLHGSPNQTLQLFSEIPVSLKRDTFSLSALLKSVCSYASESPTHSSVPYETHAFALRNGFDADLFVANGLITAYARADSLISARKVFEAIPQKDIISWNSMLSGYSQSGHYHACLELYQKMEQRQDDIVPNGVTMVTVLQACAQLKDLMFGMTVHQFIIGSSMEMDSAVWNSIIGFYGKCGSLDYARELFNEMPEKDGVSFSAMITGYMSYGFVDRAIDIFRRITIPVLSTWNAVIAGLFLNSRYSEALDLFREMQECGLHPSSVTLSCVLPALSYYSNLMCSKEIHGYSIKTKSEQNIYVATALIEAYSKAGYLGGARRVFEYTKVENSILWTAIISAYASYGDAEASTFLFERMAAKGIKPDSVTFTAVLTACTHVGAVDKAQDIFYTRLQQYEISATVEHYACMVGVYSRAGLLKEAVDFIKRMPLEPNAKAWGALLNGAAVAGDVEVGRFAFENLFEIEPENTGNYILMANIYSRAKKWEEAEKVRDRMRHEGLAKIPGCSWIETSKGLQVFVASDTSGSSFEEIYRVLERLVAVMTEESCRYDYDNELYECVSR